MSTAQQLFAYAKDNKYVQANLEKTFRTLARHKASQVFDTEKALALLANNVRDAARYYVHVNGQNLAWTAEFPVHEREGCAALFLRQFDSWYKSHYEPFKPFDTINDSPVRHGGEDD